MEIILDGTKHTIPDGSTHVAVDGDGCCYVYFPKIYQKFSTWVIDYEVLLELPPPKDFTKCLAEVHDGAVISFEGM